MIVKQLKVKIKGTNKHHLVEKLGLQEFDRSLLNANFIEVKVSIDRKPLKTTSQKIF